MKIGEISNYNPDKYKSSKKDPYLNDPIRSGDLIYHSVTPCNAELSQDSIMENWITQNEDWYIRNHHPVPNINIDNYCLQIEGEGLKPHCFKLEEFKSKFKVHSVITTIQCGGNRRAEYNTVDKTSGNKWGYGAMSNAEWTGFYLRDIFEYIMDDLKDSNKENNIEFESYDTLKASIPSEKVFNPSGDVLIAYKMNGEDIPRDHGYPMRAIVPGYVGIRNVKWLKKIRLQKEESEGTWQRGISYKRLAPNVKTANGIDLSKIPAMYDMPIQSFIVENNEDKVRGIAWSGDGRGILRVEISFDKGISWTECELKEGSDQKIGKSWAWTFWEYNKDKNNNKEKSIDNLDNINEIWCRATDTSYNIQPRDIRDIWNMRGLCNNSWNKFIANL
tara:strand:- start:18 stop:1184 length:1167 start_codon:yes stop_codon:yes gene_type:complete